MADVNGDKKPDIIAVGGDTCAWYENPSWKKRIVSTGKQTPGIICSATADLDGDGKAEIAIAYEFEMNQPTMGKLLLAVQGDGPDDPWKLVPIADVGSIHRLRWGDVDGDTQLDLVVAPIFGREARPPDYASRPAPGLLDRRRPEARKWTSSRHRGPARDPRDRGRSTPSGDGRLRHPDGRNEGVDLFRGAVDRRAAAR